MMHLSRDKLYLVTDNLMVSNPGDGTPPWRGAGAYSLREFLRSWTSAVIKRSVGDRAPGGRDRSSLRGGGTSVPNTTSPRTERGAHRGLYTERGAHRGIYTERGGGTTVPYTKRPPYQAPNRRDWYRRPSGRGKPVGYGPPGGWNAGMPRLGCGSACGGGSAWAEVAVRACGPIYSVFLFFCFSFCMGRAYWPPSMWPHCT